MNSSPEKSHPFDMIKEEKPFSIFHPANLVKSLIGFPRSCVYVSANQCAAWTPGVGEGMPMH